MMRPSDRIVAPSRGTLRQAKEYAARLRFPNADRGLSDYLSEVFRLAPLVGLDPAIVVAQSAHETGNWTSPWWRDRLNPAGIGITGDPVQNEASKTWANGTDAARAQIVHLIGYAVFNPRNEPGNLTAQQAATVGNYRDLDPRWDALRSSGWMGTVRTIADLAGKWATDPEYAEGICARGNAIFPTLEDQAVPTFTTAIPGLPGGPLVTDYPIDTTTFMIPAGNTFQRPGIPARTPRRSVQHQTGNPNSLARGDAAWVRSGADGAQVSMHFECDDAGCYQLVPVNEVTWQAADGGGPGNMNGVSCEMTENAAVWSTPARRDRAVHVAADLMGRIAARLGVHSPERHWDFNAGTADRHHCPNLLMNTGLWESAYVPLWNAARVDELRRMGGQTATTTTTPAPKPPGPPKLPKGMSTGLAKRLFNPNDVRRPDTGEVVGFARGGPVTEEWVRRGIASIPKGKTWKDGDWPPLVAVVKRGDGRLDYQFATFVYERAAP